MVQPTTGIALAAAALATLLLVLYQLRQVAWHHQNILTYSVTTTTTTAGGTATLPFCNVQQTLDALARADVDRGDLVRSVGHGGTAARLRRVLGRVARGEDALRIGVIGGSISLGRHLGPGDKTYSELLLQWALSVFPDSQRSSFTLYNDARGGTGSGYFRYCFKEHLRGDENVILVELAVNDSPFSDANARLHHLNEEKLVRELLALPQAPAVVLLGFPRQDEFVTAEESLLQLAVYYDLPLISLRNTVYSQAFSHQISVKDVHKRLGMLHHHPDQRGHALMAHLLIHFLQTHALPCGGGHTDSAAAALGPAVDYGVPAEAMYLTWRAIATSEGCWTIETKTPSLVPDGPLDGWELHEINGKRSYRTSVPSRPISFGFRTDKTNMHAYLFNLRAEYLNGTVGECYVDNAREDAATVPTLPLQDGQVNLNVGARTAIALVPLPGEHRMTCQLVSGNDFRIMGILTD